MAVRRKRISVKDFRKIASHRLPRYIFDYIDGAAEDEIGLRHNRVAFSKYKFIPRRFIDVRDRVFSTSLFGRTLAAPMFIAPTGGAGLIQPNGDLALARAAGKAGIPFVLSMPAQNSIEEVADIASGDVWFQLYFIDKSVTSRLLTRAQIAGFNTLVLTVDVPTGGKRERDLRNGFSFPLRPSLSSVIESLRCPVWLIRHLQKGRPALANLVGDSMCEGSIDAVASRTMNSALNWEDLKWIRDSWQNRLIVKGILHAADAERCIDYGADAVFLSNHGGRQLDFACPTIFLLSQVRELVHAPILIDSGFRRGSDIVKAMALGASAIGLGRTVLYGLAVGGEAGVHEVLRILKEEIDCTLAQIGCRSLHELNPTFITENCGSVRCHSSDTDLLPQMYPFIS